MQTATAFAALTEACRRDPPLAVLVLGSGMGGAVERVRVEQRVAFAEVPGLPPVSVAGHKGCLALGSLAGRRVLVQEGRLHYYEGHPWDVVVRPIVTAAALGARVALLSNAGGGIADSLPPGSLMALADHLEWNRPYAWRHPGPGGLGPARPAPYSARLLRVLGRSAHDLGFEMPAGLYAAVTGPCYETPAEVRALRACGAAAVGMSTTREVQAAVAAGMECAAVSCITNRAAGLSGDTLNHEEVLAIAASLAGRLTDLLERFLTLLPGGNR